MPYHPESLEGPTQGNGGVPSNASNHERPWNPIELSLPHTEMIKQWVHGIPVSRIAYNFKRYGQRYSNRQIQRVIHSQKGQEFASFYSAQMHGGIEGLTYRGAMYAPEALYSELDLMRNPLVGERHRLNAAQDIMDRVGPPKISRQETENKVPQTIVINLLPSQLSQFLAPPVTVEAEAVVLLDNPSSANEDV